MDNVENNKNINHKLTTTTTSDDTVIAATHHIAAENLSLNQSYSPSSANLNLHATRGSLSPSKLHTTLIGSAIFVAHTSVTNTQRETDHAENSLHLNTACWRCRLLITILTSA